MQMAKEVTTIRIESEVMERVKYQAQKENRPISNFIETVLIRYFEEIDKKENPGD